MGEKEYGVMDTYRVLGVDGGVVGVDPQVCIDAFYNVLIELGL